MENMKDGTILNSKGISTFVEHAGWAYTITVVQYIVLDSQPVHIDGTIDLNLVDGSVAKGFDVLVGADGIWSAVRAQLWNEPSARPGTCTYSGLFRTNIRCSIAVRL